MPQPHLGPASLAFIHVHPSSLPQSGNVFGAPIRPLADPPLRSGDKGIKRAPSLPSGCSGLGTTGKGKFSFPLETGMSAFGKFTSYCSN